MNTDLIRNAAHEFLKDDRWRMAPIAQWHVTALFIGERNSDDLSRTEEAMITVAHSTAPIVVRNGRICSMPEPEPHMLWVRFDPDPTLTGLHLQLAEATATRPSKYLPIVPHITLARSRRSPPPASSGVIIEELQLDHLSLFRSELHHAGVIHHLLRTVPLME